LFFLQNCSIS